MTEYAFRQNKIFPFLKNRKIYYVPQQVNYISGVPDIIGCLNGKFFGWELKSSKSIIYKFSRKGYANQIIALKKIKKNNGIAWIIYPEIFDTLSICITKKQYKPLDDIFDEIYNKFINYLETN